MSDWKGAEVEAIAFFGRNGLDHGGCSPHALAALLARAEAAGEQREGHLCELRALVKRLHHADGCDDRSKHIEWALSEIALLREAA